MYIKYVNVIVLVIFNYLCKVFVVYTSIVYCVWNACMHLWCLWQLLLPWWYCFIQGVLEPGTFSEFCRHSWSGSDDTCRIKISETCNLVRWNEWCLAFGNSKRLRSICLRLFVSVAETSDDIGSAHDVMWQKWHFTRRLSAVLRDPGLSPLISRSWKLLEFHFNPSESYKWSCKLLENCYVGMHAVKALGTIVI